MRHTWKPAAALATLLYTTPGSARDICVEVADILVDAASLAGKKVAVSGWIFGFNNHWRLSQSRDGGAAVYVDMQFVPRGQQRDLFVRCTASRCRAVIRGDVGPVDFGETGLTADQVNLTPPPS